MSRLEDNQIRFRGFCMSGRLKGKEIEGTINIDSAQFRRGEGSGFDSGQFRRGEGSGFGSLVILLLLALGINVLIVNKGEFSDSRSPEDAPQVLEESNAQYFDDLPLDLDEGNLVESTRDRE